MAREYILLPSHGWRSSRMTDFLQQRPVPDIGERGRVVAAGAAFNDSGSGPRGAPCTILRSIGENGPKLARMEASVARRLQADHPDLILNRLGIAWTAATVARRVAAGVAGAKSTATVSTIPP